MTAHQPLADTTLAQAYGDLAELVQSLDEPQGCVATGCAGWCVRDLVLHLLSDAQRALVALHTTVDAPQTTDAVRYWSTVPPGTDAGLRAVRVMAAAYSSLELLAGQYAETAAAVLHATGAADPQQVVVTQGSALRVADLVDTLVVEAAVHHLDLVVALDRPGPAAAPLAAVRRTAEALLGAPFPAGDDAAVARTATGRAPAPADLADRLPVFR